MTSSPANAVSGPTRERPPAEAVAGIILAAGESSRMGADKALLRLGGMSFVERILSALDGQAAPIVVVLGHHADEIAAAIPVRPSIEILRNTQYKQGQMSSLKAAVARLEETPADAALLCLVDHPAVSADIVGAIIARRRETRAPIVVPSCRNRRGHPVLFGRELFGEVLQAPVDQGAISVFRRYQAHFEYVVTEDEGVLLDVDTPADYENLQRYWEERRSG